VAPLGQVGERLRSILLKQNHLANVRYGSIASFRSVAHARCAPDSGRSPDSR
jgi:hypothetical protein